MHAGGEGTSELNVVRSTSLSALDRGGDHKKCKVFIPLTVCTLFSASHSKNSSSLRLLELLFRACNFGPFNRIP